LYTPILEDGTDMRLSMCATCHAEHGLSPDDRTSYLVDHPARAIMDSVNATIIITDWI